MSSQVALGVCEKHKGKILSVALVAALVGFSFFLQAQSKELIVPPEVEPLKFTESLPNNTYEDLPLNVSNATGPLFNNNCEDLPLNVSNATRPLFNNNCEDSPLNVSNATRPLFNKTFQVSTAPTSQPTAEAKEVIAALKPPPPSSDQEKNKVYTKVMEHYKRPVAEVWGELADETRRKNVNP